MLDKALLSISHIITKILMLNLLNRLNILNLSSLNIFKNLNLNSPNNLNNLNRDPTQILIKLLTIL